MLFQRCWARGSGARGTPQRGRWRSHASRERTQLSVAQRAGNQFGAAGDVGRGAAGPAPARVVATSRIGPARRCPRRSSALAGSNTAAVIATQLGVLWGGSDRGEALRRRLVRWRVGAPEGLSPGEPTCCSRRGSCAGLSKSARDRGCWAFALPYQSVEQRATKDRRAVISRWRSIICSSVELVRGTGQRLDAVVPPPLGRARPVAADRDLSLAAAGDRPWSPDDGLVRRRGAESRVGRGRTRVSRAVTHCAGSPGATDKGCPIPPSGPRHEHGLGARATGTPG